MDYTLAIYDQARMDSLQVDATVARLVKRGYPSYLMKLEYDYRFPIRGLLVDKRFGHLLKMNRFKVVRKGWHGMKPLPKETLRDLYTQHQIRPADRPLPLDRHAVFAGRGDGLRRHRGSARAGAAKMWTTRSSSATCASPSTRRTATARSTRTCCPSSPSSSSATCTSRRPCTSSALPGKSSFC